LWGAWPCLAVRTCDSDVVGGHVVSSPVVETRDALLTQRCGVSEGVLLGV
jgi:hypothetical protein